MFRAKIVDKNDIHFLLTSTIFPKVFYRFSRQLSKSEGICRNCKSVHTLPHLFMYFSCLSQSRFHKSASLCQPHANIFRNSNSFLFPFLEGEFWSLGEESGISSSAVCVCVYRVGGARIKLVTMRVRREKWRDPCMTSCTRKLTSFATLVTDGISRPVQGERNLHTHTTARTHTCTHQKITWRGSLRILYEAEGLGSDVSFCTLVHLSSFRSTCRPHLRVRGSVGGDKHSCETLASIYQTARCHIPEDRNLIINRLEILKYSLRRFYAL
jgi:hypothetical protein